MPEQSQALKSAKVAAGTLLLIMFTGAYATVSYVRQAGSYVGLQAAFARFVVATASVADAEYVGAAARAATPPDALLLDALAEIAFGVDSVPLGPPRTLLVLDFPVGRELGIRQVRLRKEFGRDALEVLVVAGLPVAPLSVFRATFRRVAEGAVWDVESYPRQFGPPSYLGDMIRRDVEALGIPTTDPEQAFLAVQRLVANRSVRVPIIGESVGFFLALLVLLVLSAGQSLVLSHQLRWVRAETLAGVAAPIVRQDVGVGAFPRVDRICSKLEVAASVLLYRVVALTPVAMPAAAWIVVARFDLPGLALLPLAVFSVIGVVTSASAWRSVRVIPGGSANPASDPG